MSEMSKKTKANLYLLFIPIVFCSYLFHEFGHWIVGEVLGNDMYYSLNYVWPESGSYIDPDHNLYVSIGGPAFTIILSLIGFIIIELYDSLYAYPIVFSQFVIRFFSLAFGGFSNQDEARIANILDVGIFIVPIIVLVILLSLTIRSSIKLKIDLKTNCYFYAVAVFSQLIVIATYEFFGI